MFDFTLNIFSLSLKFGLSSSHFDFIQHISTLLSKYKGKEIILLIFSQGPNTLSELNGQYMEEMQFPVWPATVTK